MVDKKTFQMFMSSGPKFGRLSSLLQKHAPRLFEMQQLPVNYIEYVRVSTGQNNQEHGWGNLLLFVTEILLKQPYIQHSLINNSFFLPKVNSRSLNFERVNFVF